MCESRSKHFENNPQSCAVFVQQKQFLDTFAAEFLVHIPVMRR